MTVYTDTMRAHLAALGPDDRALEVGSGGRRIDERVVALELAPIPGCDVAGSVLDLPFPDACFDYVFSQAVLEHVTDPFRAFDEMVRVLRPGRLLHCMAAFMQPVHLKPMHYFNVTPHGAELLARRAGLVDVTVHAWAGIGDTMEWWAESLPECAELVRLGREMDALLPPERRWDSAAIVEVTGRRPG